MKDIFEPLSNDELDCRFLMEQPDDFEPMFEESVVDGKTHTIVDEWCEGYIRGVALASEQWALTPAISIL